MGDRDNWLSLAKVQKYRAMAEARGVSAVARGAVESSQTDMGFLQAYEECRGSRSCMDHKPVQAAKPRGQTWGARRSAFVMRHLAALHARAEPLFEDDGPYRDQPTRHHLALIMWAYSPVPSKI